MRTSLGSDASSVMRSACSLFGLAIRFARYAAEPGGASRFFTGLPFFSASISARARAAAARVSVGLAPKGMPARRALLNPIATPEKGQ